jgi:thiamine biosynthesis lipoprotein
VVDRLAAIALGISGVASVMVDLGGDICVAGATDDTTALVGIEDPFAIADNAPPIAIVGLRRGAISTSGGGRRGWSIGGQWFGHLIDSRTGWPLPRQRSCSVIADSTAAADAAASAFVVTDDATADLLTDELRLAVIRIADDGGVWRSSRWIASVDERSVDRDPQQDERDE